LFLIIKGRIKKRRSLFLTKRIFQMKLQICILLSLLLLFCVAPAFAFCQENPLVESEEDLEFLEDVISTGYKGAYRNAVEDLEEYLADFPGSCRAWDSLAAIERLRGRYEQSLKAAGEWEKLEPVDESALVALAETLFLLGRQKEGEAKLRKGLEIAPTSLKVRRVLAKFLFETGRRQAARKLAEESLKIHPFGSLNGYQKCDLSELYVLAGNIDHAAEAAVFADAEFNKKRGSGYLYKHYEALLLLGDIYRRTRLGSGSGDMGSGNRALSCFRDALRVNSRHPDAHLGLALTRCYAYNFSKAHSHLDDALAANPLHFGALALKAHLLTLFRSYSGALKLIEKGLAVNPREKRLLGQKAAIHYLKGEEDKFSEIMSQALAVDPSFGEGYFMLSELLIFHYRFPEAEKFANKCLELDPEYYEAYILLGRALANLGREEEAKDILKSSLKIDPFNYPWRNNMLRVLSDLDAYLELDTEYFKVKLDVKEANVMRHYLIKWGRESMELLGEKYGFKADGPILMEMFPENQDFAVRTMGFTGLGALGACFGQVVTLLSPKAKQLRGHFCWASTLHHELCHVFTLQMSNYRIPRWFTEGISVYEEGKKRSTWIRNMDMELFSCFNNNTLFSLRNFNSGFMGPRVMFAYYQAGLTVKFIVDVYGMDSMRKMIIAYGKDLSTRGVIKRVLGKTIDEFDEAFKEWIWNTKLSKVKCKPSYTEEKRLEIIDDLFGDNKNPKKLIKAAWACLRNNKSIDALYYLNMLPEDHDFAEDILLIQAEISFLKGRLDHAEETYKKAIDLGADDLFAWRTLGIIASKKRDKDTAINYLLKAKACFPSYISSGSPSMMLLNTYTQNEMKLEAVMEIESLVQQGLVDIDMILTAAKYHDEMGKLNKAYLFYDEAMHIDPFRIRLHIDFARICRLLSKYSLALEELEIALNVKTEHEPKRDPNQLSVGEKTDINQDVADIYAEKGAVLYELDKQDEALVSVNMALSLKSGHPQAKSLKKKIESSLKSK